MSTHGRFAQLGQGKASTLATSRDVVPMPEHHPRPGLVDVVISGEDVTSMPARCPLCRTPATRGHACSTVPSRRGRGTVEP